MKTRMSKRVPVLEFKLPKASLKTYRNSKDEIEDNNLHLSLYDGGTNNAVLTVIDPQSIDSDVALETIYGFLLKREASEVIIPSDSILWGLGKKFNFPGFVKTVGYRIEKNNDYLPPFTLLPETVTDLNILTYQIKHETLRDLIASIPAHITSVNIPNIFGWYDDTDKGNAQLAEIFAAFPLHIKKINAVDYYDEHARWPVVNNTRLKSVLLKLSSSVDEFVVREPEHHYMMTAEGSVRTVNMQEFRTDYYFPKSYDAIRCRDVVGQIKQGFIRKTDPERECYNTAKALLIDYIKEDSGLVLFFTFHWNRHHRDKVRTCIETSNDIHELIEKLEKIQQAEGFNPMGSLGRRIQYIKNMMRELKIERPVVRLGSNLI